MIHDSAMVADAWATALFVLGPDDGLKVADEKGIAAVFILGGEGKTERAMVASLLFSKLDFTFRGGED